MPFYEYQCESCGHHLEAMQKVSDAPLKKCPECGKSQLKRLMSAPVFRLKGSGWYETDFKSEKEDKRNLAERPEGKEEKKDAVEPAPGAAEGAKTADKKETVAEKPTDKPADKTVIAAPSKPIDTQSSSARSASGTTGSPRSAKSAPRAARPVKKAVKRRLAGRSARRR
ncbi:MAG TPA: FmdB family zinc ribbon protein [Steroidobacteraceae bacterium]|nr:FmdB family zinc ribbon protein [Steroidobacteraceae bacterium]